jgi:hypothetical protein
MARNFRIKAREILRSLASQPVGGPQVDLGARAPTRLRLQPYAVSRRGFTAFVRTVADGAFLPRPMRLARSERACA